MARAAAPHHGAGLGDEAVGYLLLRDLSYLAIVAIVAIVAVPVRRYRTAGPSPVQLVSLLKA